MQLKARVPVRLDGTEVSNRAVTRDISPQGVFLYIESQIVEGAQLEVVLPIPSTPHEEPNVWVRCKCTVVRVEEVPDAAEFGVAATIEEFEAIPQAVTGEDF
jgi:hypothetical protein